MHKSEASPLRGLFIAAVLGSAFWFVFLTAVIAVCCAVLP